MKNENVSQPLIKRISQGKPGFTTVRVPVQLWKVLEEVQEKLFPTASVNSLCLQILTETAELMKNGNVESPTLPAVVRQAFAARTDQGFSSSPKQEAARLRRKLGDQSDQQ